MSFRKKIRFLFRFLGAIFKKQSKNIVLGIGLGIVLYFAIPLAIKYIPKPRSIVKIGMVGQFTTNEIPDVILDQISLGLTTVNEKGEILPSLAESWTATDDGKLYTFKLKSRKMFWHDNEQFLPKDVNYNFKDVTISSNGFDIEFKLKESFSPFPYIVSRPLFKKGLIGLGDSRVSKIEKNGKFIKSLTITPVTNKDLPTKIYKFYVTENDLKTAFNLGEINRIDDIFSIEGINLSKNTSIHEIVMDNVYLGLFLDTAKLPFTEKTFRQALAYAIPKDALSKRALGPINPSSWAYNPDVKPYEQDLKKSVSLLEPEKESLPNINITISTPPQYVNQAEAVKENWKKIGVNSTVKVYSFIPQDFDALLIAREIPKEPDQYYYWHSTQEGNITGFKNPRIDKLLEDGRRTVDKEERKDFYYDFQRFLVEESPAVFLSHPVSYSIQRN